MSANKNTATVTSELDEIVAKIIEAGKPLKVVLFGSRARGDHRPDSDIDLLIVEHSSLPRYKRSARYYVATMGLFPAIEIVVWAPDEIREWEQVPNHFVTAALREGKVLYERSG